LLPFTAGGTVHSLEQFPLLVLCSFILLITSYTPRLLISSMYDDSSRCIRQ
jgi:hypothetical protein